MFVTVYHISLFLSVWKCKKITANSWHWQVYGV